jgi:hypothetical protein
MLPTTTIYMYDAIQGLVDERVARAKRHRLIHRVMSESKARKQFRLSVIQGLANGLGERDLASELRSIAQAQFSN